MAIAGLLVHTLKEDLERVERQLESLPGITTYGAYQDRYIVVVAEAPAERLEKAVGRIEALEGVLTVYTTYVTVEDELTDDGD